MNRISGFGGIFKVPKKYRGHFGAAEMDDHTLTRHMRTMAVNMRVTGAARLGIKASQIRRLNALIQEARRIESVSADAGDALRRLVQDARLIEACAQQARQDGGMRLPACDGVPRIGQILNELCLSGEMRLNRDRLMLALASFDDVQALTMKELWAAPEAMRVSLTQALIHAAESVVDNAGQRRAAELWVQRPGGSLSRQGAAFFERALQLSGEQELPEIRLRLERFLRDWGQTPEQVIRQAHEAQAMDQMRLDNLLANKRLIDELDWLDCFEELSTVDAELRYDPADVYANMDEQSRAAVREQVALIARRLKLGEMTIARHAVSAAQAARQEADEVKTTVCYWLMDDAGRAALMQRMGISDRALPAMIPDPTGVRCVAAISIAAAVFFLIFMGWVANPWLWLAGVPLAWMAANALIGAVYPRFFPPARLLKLEINHVPDAWRTLVVMPVLLSSTARAEEICAQIEALGCLESDENIQYLLLGDFSDGPHAHQKEDDGIVASTRAMIQGMNARAGWDKYAYLHRPRTFLKADNRWMGFDRKRGALMALNRVLMGVEGAESAFEVEGSVCERLKGRFAFVVTLDADTRLLPGTVQKLIGTLAHPLNRPSDGRGYAVLQPQMELMPAACVNAFVRLFAGSGGVNTYPVSVSNFWQDLTGKGLFAGKGIYDVRAFYGALEGALPEGRILSHDMIEGAIARAGFVGDITFYDGYPTTLSSSMRRLNRWTRGDWQLLPQLFSRKSFPNGHRHTHVNRLHMVDNLLRSLFAPALLALFIGAVWTGNANALLAALILAYFRPILGLFCKDRLKWRRATAELTILPVVAWNMVDAIVRTLWRLAVSGKHMLDWVTAADAETRRDDIFTPGRVAAILLAPGLFVRGWIPAALALAALFLVGPGWIRDMEEDDLEGAERLSTHQISVLTALARDTWRFFEKYVPMDGCALPPDNVQIDPPVGVAHRTSPTNIGLYLVSCLAARRMGFIRSEEMQARMAAAMDAVDQMEKWQGHLFNWYDTDSLLALKPRYVSAVDSGNLAASLMLCASGLDIGVQEEASLAARMMKTAREMNFLTLYDAKRELFVIGADTESGRLSESHYDLLASESRILSYVAMMLGQAPTRHWRKLSRPAVPVGDINALVSWSGTMFEYLMPEIFMHAPSQSLLGESARAVVRAQRQLGRERQRPWGVSESGYYAFDMHLNYQYRAFGLRMLALGGSTVESVVAPYACVLALPVAPSAVAQNVEVMRKLGWAGECGLYEAADYTRRHADGTPSLVKSHMAHHQGMILCALCNVLTDDSLTKDFMRQPQAQALALMLQEKTFTGIKLKGHGLEKAVSEPAAEVRSARTARPSTRLVDAHLLYGAQATALVTADGAVHYMRKGVNATRFGGDFLNRMDGACTHLHSSATGNAVILGGATSRAVFDAGVAIFQEKLDEVQAEMTLCVSPEDGSLIRAIELCNHGEHSVELTATDVAPVALAPAADMRAHAIFRNLFVESARLARCAVIFRRRPREKTESCPILVHMVSTPGSAHCETDYEKLVGRMGGTMRADGIAQEMTNTVGTVLNPVSALQTQVRLAPGERLRLHFALALLDPDASPEKWLDRHLSETLPERAMQLSMVRAQAMLGFIGLKANQHHLLQRLSALLFDGRLAVSAKEAHQPVNGLARSTLWQLGVSGDLPILIMQVTDARQAQNVHCIIRAHEFYRAMGVWTDLVLINDFGGGYDQPVRDMLTEQIAASHLRDLGGIAGGVWLLDGQQLSEVQRLALKRAASAEFSGEQDFYVQVRGLLTALDVPAVESMQPMMLGEPTFTREARTLDNGYGGFLQDGSYAIDVLTERTTPAPWANILANDTAGILLTERAGGFLWQGNSRSGRLTAFGNDALSEGWGLMLYLINPESGEAVRLLPGDRPDTNFRVRFNAAQASYAFQTQRLSGCVDFCVRDNAPEIRMRASLANHGLTGEKFHLIGFVDWLMGTDAQDAVWLRAWSEGGACFASGTAAGVGYFAAADEKVCAGAERNAFLGRGTIMFPEGLNAPAHPGGWTLNIPLNLRRGTQANVEFAIGWAESVDAARSQVRAFYGDPGDAFRQAQESWAERMAALSIETPDEAVNRMVNGFLVQQSRSSRICGRTGLYQPGGAYGFRDQLQDMLAILHFEPMRVRDHILRCAAHQFEAGDVMHWWHEPWLGVRTRITDDCLFLPYVTAAYVNHTQDSEILEVPVAYLENVEIPEGKEDIFCEMHPGHTVERLHDHCMRAFRKAAATGSHGLALMGTGDWNDGMNRVGDQGKGESVWLSEFLSACAARYAEIAPDEVDRAWLNALSAQMNAAIEEFGWDGAWYLRAYTDDGGKLGSQDGETCRIDAISQAWAVLAGLDAHRCARAMDSAWELLVDQKVGIIRLLTPPFGNGSIDPGYIQGYPAGIRENGAQYTHGACWLLLAMIHMGDSQRAHAALRLLMPPYHSDTPEKAQIYRVEPYVMAADVYSAAPNEGRGGWTWYTGAASWMYTCILELLGYERRGDRVRLNALLGEWPRACVTVRFGRSRYRLICNRTVSCVSLDGMNVNDTFIQMRDDGREHEAFFPVRQLKTAILEQTEEQQTEITTRITP